MNLKTVLGWSSALCLGAGALQAQETNDLESLRKQLQQATQNFDKAIQEQRRVIEGLNNKIETLEQVRTNLALAPSAPVTAPPESKSWRPTDPIRLADRSPNYLNLSLDGLFAAGGSTARDVDALQLGGHDPSQRGFTVQNVEMVLDGAVDPYFRGQGNLIFFIDPDGETVVELEEAYLESISLPGNLQLRAGQYFTEFGRHNPTHPHSWGFVDTPLVNGSFLGGDGLRNPGARLSWLMPTPFYSELLVGVQNSHGETGFEFSQRRPRSRRRR